MGRHAARRRTDHRLHRVAVRRTRRLVAVLRAQGPLAVGRGTGRARRPRAAQRLRGGRRRGARRRVRGVAPARPGDLAPVGRRRPRPAGLPRLCAVGGHPGRRSVRRLLHGAERLGLPLRLRRRLGPLRQGAAAARRRCRLHRRPARRRGRGAAVRTAVPGPRPAGAGGLRRNPDPARGGGLRLLLLQAALPAARLPPPRPHGPRPRPDLAGAPRPGGARLRRPDPGVPDVRRLCDGGGALPAVNRWRRSPR
ncbi:putative Alpha/beta hydrolase fold [Streptomyces misionensis JCM 4497]